MLAVSGARKGTERGAADLAVVGGGVIGCAVARAAAREGLSTIVFERGRIGREATWAAGGMLSPLGESHEPDAPLLELGVESLRLYPEFVGAVEEESGRNVDFVRWGKLEVAPDAAAETRLRERTAWQRERGHRVRWLDPDAVREREPVLEGPVLGGALLEDEAAVDNRLLAGAVADAAEAAGVELRPRTVVRGIALGDAAVEGVELEDGRVRAARRIVVAAGAWSGRLEGLPRPLPVRPVRGQMLALRTEPGTLGSVVDDTRVYLIPRSDGRIVVGSTMEEAGFEVRTTAGEVKGLLDAALRVAPGLADAAVDGAWAGLRPGTPDDLPILGPDPAVDGLFYATGHFRNGILLAPVTAAALAPLLAGRDPSPVSLEPFRPDRFAGRASREDRP